MSFIYNLTDTWNNIATVFTAVKMNVTDTNSDAASLLMDLQVAATSKFKVSKDGTTTFANSYTLSGDGGGLGVGFAGNFYAVVRNNSSSVPGVGIPANGFYTFSSNNNDAYTAGDTQMARVAAGIVKIQPATGSVGGAIATATCTVANLPAAATAGVGARAFVTDANATVIAGLGLTVVGGGANKVPVYSDGAAWKIG